MSVTLQDPEKLQELCQAVERDQLNSSVLAFIESLDLPADEETVIASSIGKLPEPRVGQGMFPKRLPELIKMVWWS